MRFRTSVSKLSRTKKNHDQAEHGIAALAPRRYAPPVDGSSTVAKIAADLRPSADGSAVRTCRLAGGG